MSEKIISPVNRILPPPTPGFERGYLFGKPHRLADLRTGMALESVVKGEKKRGKWKVDDTRLECYTFKPGQEDPTETRVNFKAYLLQETKKAAQDGRIIKVLDFGMGSGRQWVDFLKENQIEFWATALTKNSVDRKIRSAAVVCTAVQLHEKFPGNYFDFVVSHYGGWEQWPDATENMLWVVKPGGEIMASGDTYMPQLKDSAHYSVKAMEGPDDNRHWFYWIQKK